MEQCDGTQTEAWKELISRLPGVLNVEIVMEHNLVREVHVLSDQTRAPKQIVRDIQSAMAARFQVDIDHRIVSVAQIPTLPNLAEKRLVCQRLELSTGRECTTIAVTLELDGIQKKGESSAAPFSYSRTRCIAQATVEAINAFLSSDCRFSLLDCKNVNVGERNVTIVGVQLSAYGKSEFLVGACPVGDDPDLSVVGAALDAVNRRILKLTFCSSN